MTIENWILSGFLAPVAVKAVFDFISGRRNGKNGNGQKIIVCPLDKQDVIKDLGIIAETLALTDKDGTPIRYMIPKLINGLNDNNESLKEICAYLKRQNAKEIKS